MFIVVAVVALQAFPDTPESGTVSSADSNGEYTIISTNGRYCTCIALEKLQNRTCRKASFQHEVSVSALVCVCVCVCVGTRRTSTLEADGNSGELRVKD